MPGLGMMGRLLLRAPSAGGVVHELEEREIEPRFFLARCGRHRSRQNDPKVEPRAMTATKATTAPTIATMTISR